MNNHSAKQRSSWTVYGCQATTEFIKWDSRGRTAHLQTECCQEEWHVFEQQVLPTLLFRLWDSCILLRSEEEALYEWWLFWWCFCLTSSITSFPGPHQNTGYPYYFHVTQRKDKSLFPPFKAKMNPQWGYWKSPVDAPKPSEAKWHCREWHQSMK